ncbi:hypothetical protein Ferp_1856 [Ferroglobus placidus DSM 10642]|uniref:Uncharacterized protein n=1 Tax=Ferroglobus placidus (strain DSM 10642 / AEDII12DO) TaxID=589924 RepID=D3RZT6_FERPA|nr:hypothetical protein Ferp_1856 [Ferroglobus placidus DSM 10642]
MYEAKFTLEAITPIFMRGAEQSVVKNFEMVECKLK